MAPHEEEKEILMSLKKMLIREEKIFKNVYIIYIEETWLISVISLSPQYMWESL